MWKDPTPPRLQSVFILELSRLKEDSGSQMKGKRVKAITVKGTFLGEHRRS